MIVIKRIASVIVLAVLVSMLILPMACKKEAAPAPEPKGEIVIGILDDFTAFGAGICTSIAQGQKDAIRYLNEESGGIDGHPLKAIVVDHKMDAALMLAGWNRLKNENAMVVLSYTGTFPAMETACQRERIPMLGSLMTLDQGYPKEKSYFFGTVPYISGTVSSAYDQIEQDWSAKGNKGTPKIATDIPEFGSFKAIGTKATKMALEKRNWEYLITYTSLAPVDVTTQTMQIKNFDADYFYLINSEGAQIVWLNELDRQNFRPTIYGSGNIIGTKMRDACGELVIGTKGYATAPQWTETDSPFIKKMLELNSKWDQDVTGLNGYTRGFGSCLAAQEALRRAVTNVGYQNLDNDAVQAAFETIKDFEPMDFGTTYTWTPTDHHGITAIRWWVWTEELTLSPASDWDYFEQLPEEQRTTAFWLKD